MSKRIKPLRQKALESLVGYEAPSRRRFYRVYDELKDTNLDDVMILYAKQKLLEDIRDSLFRFLCILSIKIKRGIDFVYLIPIRDERNKEWNQHLLIYHVGRVLKLQWQQFDIQNFRSEEYPTSLLREKSMEDVLSFLQAIYQFFEIHVAFPLQLTIINVRGGGYKFEMTMKEWIDLYRDSPSYSMRYCTLKESDLKPSTRQQQQSMKKWSSPTSRPRLEYIPVWWIFMPRSYLQQEQIRYFLRGVPKTVHNISRYEDIAPEQIREHQQRVQQRKELGTYLSLENKITDWLSQLR